VATNDITISMREMERLIEWIRRSGRPQTVASITRRYVEMLREDRGIKAK
jgi:hypothetical protein